MRRVSIVAFLPVESPWSAMPYFCVTEHKTGDIVKIKPQKYGELNYIFTDESHDVVYPDGDSIPAETDSFPAGKYYRVYCLNEIALLHSNIPLKMEGFTEERVGGVYRYESKKWGLIW